MVKHAYLILAHDDVPLLQLLLNGIDDARNDIYVHWDLKSGDVPKLSCKNAGLFFLENRISVNWGGYSIVEAEFCLFKRAAQSGPYAYYHLLSGRDLPIKTQDHIHSMCEALAGTEFIAFSQTDQEELDFRVQHYFLFPESFKGANLLKRAARKLFNLIQDWTKFRRTDVKVAKGSQWCSLTQDFVDYLLTQEDFAKKLFSHTYCPDELFIQTITVNSRFAGRIKPADNEFDGNMRYIKWINGDLKPIEQKDFQAMKNSDKWFARKFSSSDKSLISLVTQLC